MAKYNLKPETLLNAEPTGNFATDNAIGREYAEALINDIRAEPALNVIKLGFAFQAIAERGRHSGLEVGFFQRLAVELAGVETRSNADR